MKLIPLILRIGLYIASSSIGISVLEVSIACADSHPNLRQAVNALSYPRSGQRFIEKGQARLETEIRYLQRYTLSSPPALRTNRDILHKQRLWQQQQERWLKK